MTDMLPNEDMPEGVSQQSMRRLPFSLCITDPRKDDNPIVYVNDRFEEVTGYTRENAVGRNCRFLQGEGTTEESREEIRAGLEKGEDFSAIIRNYRSNGEPFVNKLLITPLRDEQDPEKILFFLGIQTEHRPDSEQQERADRLDESLREIQHRVKNHLQMLLALIRAEARNSENIPASLDTLAGRVESLNLLYQEFAHVPGNAETQQVALGAYLSRVASALSMLDGHREVIVNIEMDKVSVSLDAASQIGLLMSELITNALQHAFEEGAHGVVEIRAKVDDERIRLSVRDDGRGIPANCDWPQEGNLGARIVRDLVRSLDGKLSIWTGGEGTAIDVHIPRTRLDRAARR